MPKFPSYAWLKETIDYNPSTGIALWLKRPRTDFTTARRWNQWNNMNAYSQVGQRNPSTGKLKVNITKVNYDLDKLIWKWYYNEEPPQKIHHVNGWTVDNAIGNLHATFKGMKNTIYEGGDLRIERMHIDEHILYVILSDTAEHPHCFGIYENEEDCIKLATDIAPALGCNITCQT